ncbi:aerobic carbon-monoxide dehydrogenase large subunit [Geodermatophilus marinus]|uniref:aerobic carbon-monoxide dehydrogenase large subunit n=1 Tax=Geodermatophilus sp. LHW52908 TaxID=2303986 RepID=UPI000E3BC4D1|nr:aerobic carbon-monoxide dehydrogenase large subunit [Geodermatophilus sp. LHW52908]RFU20196.1 xanthine dehydrogenase family protein molybdopterin-binding subunit [Geodermatophilus sp. LHW52908]
MTTKLFGEPVRRREDARLITGRGRYLDDIGAGALAAAFVRSPHAHARITGIDVDAALDVEGLVAIYTYEDLTGPLAEPLPVLIPHPQLHAPRTGYPLANGEVNHVGEPVVMVVATDRYVAEDACDRIVVSYEELPAVVGVDAARAAEHAVHEEIPGNVAARHHQETGDVEPALAASPHTLSFTQYIERSACMPLEGKGVHARWDPDDSSLRVHTSTQASTSVRAAIAAKLELSLDAVEVVAPDVGGGFGVKIVHPWPEELLVPMAAIALGREVKWAEDRREHFISSAHERQQRQEITVGYDDEGRVTALDVHIWHDNGAYTPYGIIVPIVTATQLVGPYDLPVYRVVVESVYTNTVIVTPYRGAGRPQGCYAMERTMDRIADALGLDRAVVRERNLIRPDQFPYDHRLTFQDGRPVIYDSGDYPGLLTKLKDLVGWDAVEERRRDAERRGKLLGAGMALYVEGTGPGPYEGGHVQVLGSGKVLVSTGLTSQGQGHETVFAQIVASELGVPIEDVEVTTGDTRRFGYAVGTFASRAAVMSGNAVALAARGVRAKALRIAADALEVDPQDLEIDEGVVQVKGTPGASIPLRTVAVLSNPLRYAFDEAARQATQFAGPADDSRPPVAEGDAPGLEHRDYYSPVRSTFASGAHAAVVEIDPATWEIDVVTYAVVHDCGNVVNPMIVEGQVHGGVAQGVGGALYERMAYDADGQLQNASFMDFLMPYASEVPDVVIDHQETPSPLNPLGIKGAGEAGVIPGTAAIASALEDATGRRIAAMPLSPTQLYDLVRDETTERTAQAARRTGVPA